MVAAQSDPASAHHAAQISTVQIPVTQIGEARHSVLQIAAGWGQQAAGLRPSESRPLAVLGPSVLRPKQSGPRGSFSGMETGLPAGDSAALNRIFEDAQFP